MNEVYEYILLKRMFEVQKEKWITMSEVFRLPFNELF